MYCVRSRETGALVQDECGWVRTGEGRGGLSEGGKGGLLHSQLVELAQLLRGGGGGQQSYKVQIVKNSITFSQTPVLSLTHSSTDIDTTTVKRGQGEVQHRTR